MRRLEDGVLRLEERRLRAVGAQRGVLRRGARVIQRARRAGEIPRPPLQQQGGREHE